MSVHVTAPQKALEHLFKKKETCFCAVEQKQIAAQIGHGYDEGLGEQ
jgi:hypothetical protein